MGITVHCWWHNSMGWCPRLKERKWAEYQQSPPPSPSWLWMQCDQLPHTPAMVNCTIKMWPEINPPITKLLFTRQFVPVISKVPSTPSILVNFVITMIRRLQTRGDFFWLILQGQPMITWTHISGEKIMVADVCDRGEFFTSQLTRKQRVRHKGTRHKHTH